MCLAIDMVIAWRIQHMTKLGREVPDLPAEAYFDRDECEVLIAHERRIRNRPKDAPPLSLYEAIRTIAKLGHNCTSAVVGVALAEVMTMGIKAGVEPLELWEAVRQGATGRQRTFDRLGKFLSSAYDPADFALRLLHKDVSLAVGLGREVGVPMRLANLALEELTEAMNRGWGQRDSRVGGLLQVERAKIPPLNLDPQKVQAVLDRDQQK